ncbi:hypothetical protein HED60_11885 [Planctomycetales bacterium ZRK34]|nr:hypothetical protein HED60_11885 [Planctomycetales bacterium ZRK34]
MSHPVEADGRSVVILRRSGHRFEVVDSGLLSYDGQMLEFPSGYCITDEELSKFQPVVDGNLTPECKDFDCFVVVDDVH